MEWRCSVEILALIFAILFVIAIKTNSSGKENRKRNGFGGDDDFDL